MPVRIIDYLNKQQSLRKWAIELGLNYRTVQSRLHDGWTVEQAFTESGKTRRNEFRSQIVGLRIGSWLVLEEADVKDGDEYYRCLCDCGNESEVRGSSLRADSTHKCLLCTSKNGSLALTKHGLCRASKRSKIWRTWRGIKNRCHNKNSRDYENYGGRGIYVCD